MLSPVIIYESVLESHNVLGWGSGHLTSQEKHLGRRVGHVRVGMVSITFQDVFHA